MNRLVSRLAPAAALSIVLLAAMASTGCDIVTADFKHSQTAEWRKTYELKPGGRVEIRNINGKIEVEPSTGNAVEIVALKTAKGASEEAAKEALERVTIVEVSSPSEIRIETKLQRTHGWLGMQSGSVKYTVRVPAAVEGAFSTVNGGVELRGLTGRVSAETTNGGVVARDVSGTLEAVTTNGGVDVELARVGEGGAKLECTNGGIKLRLPADARASISASITNGGISTDGLQLETLESSRRRLEARLNGGGPPIRISGTNGGITIGQR
jgi:DUF4097 and DUF4098 domain-containing protein YvlB